MARGKRQSVAFRPMATTKLTPDLDLAGIALKAFKNECGRGEILSCVEVAPGVFFGAPKDSFNKGWTPEESLMFLFAIRGHSCIPEVAWEAAAKANLKEDYGNEEGFLDQMAILPDGKLAFRNNCLDHVWRQRCKDSIVACQVWYVADDQSQDSWFYPLFYSCPEIQAGLTSLNHLGAKDLGGMPKEELEQYVKNPDALYNFAALLQEENLFRKGYSDFIKTIHPRRRPSPMAS